MQTPTLRTLLVALLISILTGCRSSPPIQVAAQSSTQSTPVSTIPSISASPIAILSPSQAENDNTFRVNGQQAQQVAVLVNLIQAYNAGQMDNVMAFIADDAGWSDCDYQAGKAVEFRGKDKVAAWLQQRRDDHDQLEIGSIQNDNPSANQVVGLTFAHRGSDTLRQRGFTNGIEPQLSAKVIFTTTPIRIIQFANGPIGGSPDVCQPK